MLDENKDWLSQEIKYESKISAWDFDEPNKIKKAHEDNCPRENLANQHIKAHQGNERFEKIETRLMNKNIKTSSMQYKQTKNVMSVFIFFIIMVLVSIVSTLIALFN